MYPSDSASTPCCDVLLVDDNRDFLDSMERFLATEPCLHVVGRAHSGRDALQQTDRLHPHVVLMDVSMPEMNGLEATQQLKTRSAPPFVIILTMYDDAEFSRAAEAVGADGFVPKGLLDTRLLPLLTALCAKAMT